MKYSHYNVVTDPINRKGNRLLYNLRTEEAVIIDAQTFGHYERGSLDISETARGTLQGIRAIVPLEENELSQVIAENKEAVASQYTFSFTILPSANCQLGCVYCGQAHAPGSLNESLYQKTLDYIDQSLTGSNRTHVAIGWFGGEPLLGFNTIKQLTPQIKDIARRHNCTYSARITTNGLLLNPRNFRTLLDNDVKDITISLDGTAEYHDQRRFTKGGKASFDVIMRNMTDVFNQFDFEKEGVEIMVRINVDTHNRDGVIPLLELFHERGFAGKIHKFDIAPIHSWGNDAHVRAIPIEEFANLKVDFYLKLLELGLMTKVPLPKRSRVVCQAVLPDARYMDAKGDLYDCSELPLVPVHKDQYRLGNIGAFRPGDDAGKRHYTAWNDEVEAHQTPCGKCKVLPVCGGGCPKAWKEGHIPCPDFKYNLKDVLRMAYLYSRNEEKFLAEMAV